MTASGPLRRAAFAVSAFVLAWPLAGYPAVLWVLARLRPRRPPAPAAAEGLPSMTVIVPTYRERANIVPRLENIEASVYPAGRLQVLVVDSASDDGTADAAEAFGTAHPTMALRVLREPRRAGKAAAVNLAIRESTGDLLLVTDAPTRFDRGALSFVAGVFADPSVGAATGQFRVFEERTATQREEGLFWRVRNRLRTLEADVDSTPFLSGEFCCFRRGLVDEIDTDSIADDMNVALQVRRQGWRSVVEPRAIFTEPRSPEVRDLLVRKVSRAAGGIQELLRHRDMILRPRYGLFGMLILPSDLLYYLPLRLPALAVVGAAILRTPRRAVPTMALGAALAVPKTRRRLLDTAYVLFLNEWLFARGWQTVLQRKTEVLWEQERRDVVPGAAWDPRGADVEAEESA